MKRIFLTILVFSAIRILAQDSGFSQFWASSLYLNPALSGRSKNLNVSTSYRMQWRSVSLPYHTHQISMIMPFVKGRVKNSHVGGMGLSVYNDKAGDGNLKTMGVNLSAAKNFSLNYNGMFMLSVGGQVGFIQRNIDFTNLRWGSDYNPYADGSFYDPLNQSNSSYNTVESGLKYNKTMPDASAGVMYYFNPEKRFAKSKLSSYVGLSAYHINHPNESMMLKDSSSLMPMIIKAVGGFDVNVSKKMNISPTVLYMAQSGAKHINIGVYVTYNISEDRNGILAKTDLILGAYHRLGDSFISMVGLSNEVYTLGFSYDYNSSGLNTFTRGRGAYEVSLSISRVQKKKIKRYSTPRI